MVFPFAWQDTDDVTIELPAGFQLEKAESPGGLVFGKPGDYKLSLAAGKGELFCKRELTFGNDGLISFAKTAYPQLKNVFDEIHRRDGITFSLRQVAPAASGVQ